MEFKKKDRFQKGQFIINITLCIATFFASLIAIEIFHRFYFKIGFENVLLWYSLDESGFRNKKRCSSLENKKKIMVLGDSFAFGHGLQYDKSFPGILNCKYGYDVINLSKPGWNTKAEIDFFLRAGLIPDPTLLF